MAMLIMSYVQFNNVLCTEVHRQDPRQATVQTKLNSPQMLVCVIGSFLFIPICWKLEADSFRNQTFTMHLR